MEPEYLADLSDNKLVEKIKKLKTNKVVNATIIGFTIGVAVYSAVKNGFGFSTFLPLLLVYLMVRNSKDNKLFEKEMRKELESRNLKQKTATNS